MAALAALDTTTPSGSHRLDADAAKAASGDRQAFERLYRKHVGRIYSLCARMVGDRTRAEELTQDVFVRAGEKRKRFRGDSSFAPCLHRRPGNGWRKDGKTEGGGGSRSEEGEEG